MRVNPLRCMRGALPAQTPANFGAVGLFNNSTGAHLIKVLTWNQGPAGNPPLMFRTQKDRLANQNVGTITPVVTDEAVGPGQIDWDDLAAVGTFDWVIPFAEGLPNWYGQTYPIAVLRPGWSFVGIAPVNSSLDSVSFFWEWVYAEDFYRESAGDSILLP